MKDSYVFLDSYILQQDMRIRLPKQVVNNLNLEKGKSVFDIYIDSETKEVILKKSDKTAADLQDKKNE